MQHGFVWIKLDAALEHVKLELLGETPDLLFFVQLALLVFLLLFLQGDALELPLNEIVTLLLFDSSPLD